MPLWCQNDPIVKLTYQPPFPHPSPVQHALVRIVTRATFAMPPIDADDAIYLELTVPHLIDAKVVQETTDPRLPQDFYLDDDEALKVIHNPSTSPQTTQLDDTFAAECTLFIELPDPFDPLVTPNVNALRVSVYDRTRALLAEYVITPTSATSSHTLNFTVPFDNDGIDHTDEVLHQPHPNPNPATSTWS